MLPSSRITFILEKLKSRRQEFSSHSPPLNCKLFQYRRNPSRKSCPRARVDRCSRTDLHGFILRGINAIAASQDENIQDIKRADFVCSTFFSFDSSYFSCILNNLLTSRSRMIQQDMTSRKKDCMWEFGINWNFLFRKGGANMYFSSFPTALRV